MSSTCKSLNDTIRGSIPLVAMRNLSLQSLRRFSLHTHPGLTVSPLVDTQHHAHSRRAKRCCYARVSPFSFLRLQPCLPPLLQPSSQRGPALMETHEPRLRALTHCIDPAALAWTVRQFPGRGPSGARSQGFDILEIESRKQADLIPLPFLSHSGSPSPQGSVPDNDLGSPVARRKQDFD
ncbi:hypothetical protein CONLIGDRAFT_650715 [Coniochaeta ligniaria NRRL 30616]|uniref:Uncharacterized protein n=1 Tax=Coniochaeta ligniaria NRRL 30616 TaxID=1408157 RepID=A0A1J7IXA7_9PEZI|nr:hypothetical protein CONLIGDRAFT_650715 [Coniochaeta ligniaria NRRL 30616]